MTISPFFQLHSALPREGPGTADDVRWALSVAGPVTCVCDVACGPGADTVVLAGALPEARIDALDKQPHFVAAARTRCAGFGDQVHVLQGDMGQLVGPYDLIWCAGALYFLGVTEGLLGWRNALSKGGRVAFSEPVLVNASPPPAVRAFWADYPAITSRDGIAERAADASYRVLDVRRIIGAAWAAYYQPLEARIDALRPGAGPELTAVLDEAAQEAATWRAHPDHVAYDLFVVTPE